MASMWNLWHGCHKISDGCRHCYVYRGDAKRGIDSSVVTRTQSFDLPVRKKKNGDYKIPSGTEVMTCFTSDFFVQDADVWRPDAWRMIRERDDLSFLMITKRIDRFYECVPDDWTEEDYKHVTICCTVENQERADYRIPIYKELPIRHKILICELLLSSIDLIPYAGNWLEQVVVGGESGKEARPCNYDWVLRIREFCINNKIPFWFKQTGARLIRDGVMYSIPRQFQHSQARKAAINYEGETR
ncbi:MAG: phage Gp37/Gp68 family protein [Tannerellaceae bacterium]|nr:phage Gp37/Gp68 family protein [Tannerellaceae bacterium]